MSAVMNGTLERTIRLRDLALLVVGVVIGSGIFIVPSTVLAQVGGDVGIALIVWLVGGVLSLLGALTYGELAAARPASGGLYVFLRDAFGRGVAFLFGWTLFLAIGAGSAATLARAFVGYLAQFVALSPTGGRLVAIGMIAVVAGINVRGTRTSMNVTSWTTGLKAVALIGLSLALLIAGPGLAAHGASLVPSRFDFAILSAMGTAMIGVLWAYEGWQWVTFSAGETVDPNRTFPRGIAIGTLTIVLIYGLANIGYVAALGPDTTMASTSVAADAVRSRFGAGAGRLVAAAILVSIFSAANAVVLTASRVFFAMARDGLFFRRLADVHPKFGTPAVSIAFFCAWAMVLASAGTFQQLLTYVVFTGWIFYALAATAIFVFRRRESGDGPERSRHFRVPGYPVTPLLFVVAALAIVLNTIVTQPGQAAAGIAVVVAGAPAYLWWRWKGQKKQKGDASGTKQY
jgi:APA family basic amino acid/polyamine antiporter